MIGSMLKKLRRAGISDLTERIDDVCRQLETVKTHLEQLRRLQAFDHVDRLLSQLRYADPKRLHRYEASAFSQDGEDGILLEIFNRVGVGSKRFLEIGVGNGLENNTTFLLYRDWRGMWIEGDERNLRQIHSYFQGPIDEGRLIVKACHVTAENVADLVRQAPSDIDLFSLDIDRNTFHVWRSLSEFRPRVVVIEYNASIPPSIEWTTEYDANRTWNGSTYFGASLKSLEKLGASLGYSLVGCDLVGVNAFFVRDDLVGEKFCTPFTAENHYEPARFYLWPKRGMHHPRCFSDLGRPSVDGRRAPG